MRSIEQVRLDNGLRVVVSEDDTAAAVAVNVWYGVGSRHERAGRTGLAHLFEHLMFQGSANVKAGEHFDRLQAVGATLNGTTSFDRTNYYETVPRGAFELALWLEADRMGGLLEALTQENMDNQRDVVKNERRQRYENQPYGTVHERLFALAFPESHQYHHLPIGSMADLDAASLDDAAGFFRTHYAPRNAVVAIVGDVSTDEATAAAKRYFGGIPAGPAAPEPPDGTVGPLPDQVRQDVTEPVPAEAVYSMWRLPVDGSRGADASELALQVLAGGSSSRLAERLERREQLARGVGAGLSRLVGGTSTGVLAVTLRLGADLETTEAVIDEELERLASEGPDDDELERARALVEHDWLDETSDYAGWANALAHFGCLFGDATLASGVVDRLHAVSGAEVRQAAELLRAERCARVVYHVAEGAVA
ncbi:MAG: insulinase family protein [Streptosporangiales bacterium]|nr:insulinase family protein [Streptosporangiales bacterium]